MNVQIPVKWLQELLALCGPEDHELRERVMASITAMNEQAARAVAMPEPDAWLAVYEGRDGNSKFYTSTHKDLAVENDKNGEPKPLYTERQVRALLAGISAPPPPPLPVPDGWREKFAADVYADLAAADNQDVPLEEYPARILKVLDSIVGPRHPVVIKWRNDAIRNCIAIAYKYCRDPESHKYLKQDLEAMLTTEPAPQAQADARDAKDRECLAIGRALNRAALELPADGEIRIEIENGAGVVYVNEPKHGDWRYIDSGDAFSAQINEAIDAAIAAAKGPTE